MKFKTTTVRLDAELHDRAMRMVYWTPGLSLTKLMSALLGEFVEKMESDIGGKFPPIHDQDLDRKHGVSDEWVDKTLKKYGPVFEKLSST